MSRIILDLCGGTGAWSRPYRDAGYDVRLVTLPENDVRFYEPPENVHGVLAAPPCTEFASSGARWWKEKPHHLLTDALEVVDACLDIILRCRPRWWVLENPRGRLRLLRENRLGPVKWSFSPCEYGEEWSKWTLLWGQFNVPPIRRWHVCQHEFWGWRQLGGKSERTKRLRSETSSAFASAFFEANP